MSCRSSSWAVLTTSWTCGSPLRRRLPLAVPPLPLTSYCITPPPNLLNHVRADFLVLHTNPYDSIRKHERPCSIGTKSDRASCTNVRSHLFSPGCAICPTPGVITRLDVWTQEK